MGKRLRGLVLLMVLVGGGVLVGSSMSQWWGPVVPTLPLPPLPRVEGRVRVEVLNAGGLSGVAREATGALRDRGFDVVYFGNAGTFSEDSSVVLDRAGPLDAARIVADVLGIRDVRTQPDSNLYVDVTVRLGPEWALPAPALPKEEPGRPWWDLRRFFRRSGSQGSPQESNP